MKSQKGTLIVVGFMFFGLLACNNNNSSEAATTIEGIEALPAANSEVLPPLPTEPENSSQPLPSGPISSPVINTGSLGSPVINNAQAAIPSAPVSVNKKIAKGLNPAHGQPGHDCAIAVGAPLSGKAPVAAAAPVQISAPSATAEQSSIAAPVPNFGPNLSPNVKVNPAHGQPGHDCAVAVGAALPGQ